MNNDKDYIFGRLNNEFKQNEEQKKRIEEKKRRSQQNWLSNSLEEAGEFLGKVVAFPFKVLSSLFSWLFGR